MKRTIDPHENKTYCLQLNTAGQIIVLLFKFPRKIVRLCITECISARNPVDVVAIFQNSSQTQIYCTSNKNLILRGIYSPNLYFH